jgi:hypothetical protein
MASRLVWELRARADDQPPKVPATILINTGLLSASKHRMTLGSSMPYIIDRALEHLQNDLGRAELPTHRDDVVS